MNCFYKIILIAFFILLRGTSYAQVPFLKIFQLEKEQGDLRIQRLLQDKKGFIWIGTSNGLYKFNGFEFLKIEDKDIHDSSVTALFEDSHQTLWVGFKGGKIGALENNSLKLFSPEGKLPGTTIHCIAESSDSVLWFATNGEGVFYYSGHHLNRITSNDGLSDDYTYTLAFSNDKSVWIGTDQGISICKLNGTKPFITKLNSDNGLPDNIVRVLLPAGNGNMWIGMQDKGVCEYMEAEKSFVIPSALKNWKSGQVNCLLKTENNLWIGTDENGIIDFETTGEMSVRYFNSQENIKLSKINDLLEDNEFNVWIANSNQLIRSSGEQITFLNDYKRNKPDQEENKKQQPYVFIHSILSDHYGNLWFTPDQGLVRFPLNNISDNKIEKFVITSPKLLVDITSLYEDKYGFLWIGTMGQGIFRMNIKTGKFIKVKGDVSLEKASILSIAGDQDVLWYAGLEGVSKCRIENASSENIRLQRMDTAETKSFGKNYIYSIFIDSKKRVWLGTDDKGLIMYDEGKSVTYTTADGLKSNVIYSITEDPSGNIWFSTLKAGIYKYDGISFKNYSIEDGLSDLNVYSVAADKNGNILIINKHGIDVLDRTSSLFTYYDRETGINEINADLNTVTKDQSGNIWIGTESGIIKYHAFKKKKMIQPVTVISSIAVFLEAVDEGRKKFHHDQNNFTFSFNGLWYSDPERVQYQYLLQGYNNNWTTSRDRSITYPRLPAGKYTFKVRSALNQDFKNAKESSWSFVIAPPFWQRWWFIVSIWLLAAVAMRFYIIRRERRIKHLEQLQKEKIEFQFETLKSQVNPHFLFNSFNTLISVIEDNPKVAVEYVERLSQFFRNIVTYREKDVIVLREELDLLDNYYFLQKKRFCENLSLKLDVPEEIKNSRYVPPLTLQLLMENAVKHNSISKETPLFIELFVNKHGKLVMRNNRNGKIKKTESPGMGLQNIISRFQLLSDRTVEIKSADNFFEVAIPLLKEE
jgi:ligand-binding sensor domain-containing protein